MTNCIKQYLCKDEGTEQCNNCKYRQTYLQEELRKIDERAKGYKINAYKVEGDI